MDENTVCLDKSGSVKILTAYRQDECLTNAELCTRTGMRLKDVAAWVAQLRKKGYLLRCSPEKRVPVMHVRILTKKERVEKLSSAATVRRAIATVPTCVWDLAKE